MPPSGQGAHRRDPRRTCSRPPAGSAATAASQSERLDMNAPLKCIALQVVCGLCFATATLAAFAQAPATAREARPTVAIYEFRSGVSEIAARAATDMFVTALVRSGRFRV